MKRLLSITLAVALFLAMCLLLVGCDSEKTSKTASDTEQPSLSTSDDATQSTVSTDSDHTPTTTTTPTTAVATSPDTDPSPTVTVYLLDRSSLFDSGYTQYYYDENGNIERYEVMTIENELMYTCFFEEQDANGMPCRVRTQWDEETGYSTVMTYFADGKPKEAQEEGMNYTGYQYGYDSIGNLSEKREYYDGLLYSMVRCEYEGDVLTSVVCENADGDTLYDCRIENGRIVEKVFYESEYDSHILYEYDEFGNLIKTTFVMDGEPDSYEIFSYKAMEVDADRAAYLLEQQKYLLAVI